MEFSRWKAHQASVKEAKMWGRELKFSDKGIWCELAAFSSILPRRSGKSTLIKRMVRELQRSDEDHSDIPCLILVPFLAQVKQFNDMAGRAIIATIASELSYHPPGSFRHANTHLFIDEFLLIPQDELRSKLDHCWKSVTLIGSLTI